MMNRKSLLYSAVLLLSLVFVAVLLNRGVVQAVINPVDSVLSADDVLTGLGQGMLFELDVAFADGETATWSGAQVIITDSNGDPVVDALLPLEFKTIDDPGFVILDGSEPGTAVMNGEMVVVWFFTDVVPFDDPASELGDSTLPGGGKFKGLEGGGSVLFTMDWLSPNDPVWLGDYTSVVNIHVNGGTIGSTSVLAETSGNVFPTNSVDLKIVTGVMVSSEEALEGDSLTFTISINPPVGAGDFLQVIWQTAEAPGAPGPGLATEGVDYAAGAGAVTFFEGVASLPVTIASIEDTAWEGDEIFGLQLVGTLPFDGGAWNQTSGTGIGTILEDGPKPVLTVPTSVDVIEGASGDVTPVEIQLSLSGERDAPLDITYYTMDGTAISGFGPSGSLAISVGEANASGLNGYVTFEEIPGFGTSVTARLFAVNGGVPQAAHLHSGSCDAAGPVEGLLSDFVTDPAGGFVSVSLIMGVFLDELRDPAAPFLFMSHDSAVLPVVCGNIPSEDDALVIPVDGADTGIATLNDRGAATEVIVSLDGAVPSGLAFIHFGDCNDVAAGTSSIFFPLHGVMEDVSITTVPFELGTLLNNGYSIVTQLAADPPAVAACGNIVTGGFDYVSIMEWTFTFPAGVDNGTVTIDVIGDDLIEPDEFFSVIFDQRAGDGQASSKAALYHGVDDPRETIVNIIDDDGVPELTISIDDVAVNENEGTSVLAVTASAVSGSAITVDFFSVDGTATAGDDYVATNGNATIPAGDLSVTISVSIINDAEDELDETFTVALSNASGATIAVGSGEVTILDDDVPNLSIGDVTVVEGAADPNARLSVASDIAPIVDIDVSVATVGGGTATENDDYSPVTVQVTILAGETVSDDILIAITDDAEIEGDETILVDLLSVTPAGAAVILDGQATVTIEDNDAAAVSDVAVTKLEALRESDGVAVAQVMVTGIKDVDSGAVGTTLGDGIVAFDAVLTFDANCGDLASPTGCSEVPDVRFVTPLDTNFSFSVDTGVTPAEVTIHGEASAGPITDLTVDGLVVAKVVVVLNGSKNFDTELTLVSLDLTVAGGTIPQEAAYVDSYRRGDVNGNGSVNVFDALFIQQCLAFLRDFGTATDECNAINTSGMRHDPGDGDKVSVFDALFVQQMLALLRDEYFVNVP